MIVIGILLNIAGLGFLCWALFVLAVYALPFFVGTTAGIYTYRTGIGPIGAVVIGFVAAAFGLMTGQYIFSVTRSPAVRLVIALLFAAPAAFAGYNVTFSLGNIGAVPQWWREAFALVGAVVVGCIAWARMAIPATPVRGGCCSGSAQPPFQSQSRGR
ncbi:hypothetical protein [Bradyrhizobium sp. CSA112]|uniref:hypothetical protein n=1 Tax=Bradyrhizobium sp. CSA112 TaxID=2699170 RepID=UPI0023B13EF5|nr:hypothetical protein [Bradyrhizobium sp. CSA112]